MSNWALNWAWNLDVEPCGAKFVLIALADMADQTDSCFPGQALLAKLTSQSERSVREHLTSLNDAGLIRVESRYTDGHRTSNRYYVAVPADFAGRPPHTGSPPAHTGNEAQFIPATVAGEPKEEPKAKNLRARARGGATREHYRSAVWTEPYASGGGRRRALAALVSEQERTEGAAS